MDRKYKIVLGTVLGIVLLAIILIVVYIINLNSDIDKGQQARKVQNEQMNKENQDENTKSEKQKNQIRKELKEEREKYYDQHSKEYDDSSKKAKDNEQSKVNIDSDSHVGYTGIEVLDNTGSHTVIDKEREYAPDSIFANPSPEIRPDTKYTKMLIVLDPSKAESVNAKKPIADFLEDKNPDDFDYINMADLNSKTNYDNLSGYYINEDIKEFPQIYIYKDGEKLDYKYGKITKNDLEKLHKEIK